jgi:CelD/BcsL family acetyltransferase involved in cellulose biosynthesis
LHGKRAEIRKIESTFISKKVRDFHMEFSNLLLKNDQLRLCLLYNGEKAISAIYAFKHDHKVFFYQSGMDPQWSKMSVGTVLLNLFIKQAFEEKFVEFDFLKGDENYKRKWSNAVRKQFKLTIYKKDFAGVLGFVGKAISSYAKNIYGNK